MAAYRILPALKDPWIQRHEYCTSELFDGYVAHQERWGRDANEIMVCAASIALDRAICVISDGIISLFAPDTPNAMSVACALGVVLHKGHYQYMTDRLPDDLVQLLLHSASEQTPDLRGGGYKLLSWNIGSLVLRWQELLSFEGWRIACLQETGATLRNQKFLEQQFTERHLSVVWGRPTPQGWNRTSKLRSMTGQVPGVAIVAAESMGLRYRTPLTKAGLHLENRGRMVVASYPTPLTQVLIVTVYLPSGGSSETVKDRQGCLEEALEEVSAYGCVPIVLVGDWNLDPSENALVPMLLAKKWGFPVPVWDNQSRKDGPWTYSSSFGTTYIDYALVSCKLPIMQQEICESGAQHSTVWLDLPTSSVQIECAEVPQAVRYGPIKDNVKPLEHESLDLLSSDLDIDSSWDLFLDQLHRMLSHSSLKAPKKRPGMPVFCRGQKRSRLTDEGGESDLAAKAFRFARRALEYSRRPTPQLLHKMQADKQACSLLHSIELVQPLQQQHQQNAFAAIAVQAREHAKTYMKELVKRRVHQWKESLTDHLQNPTSPLFRWLKQEGPQGPIVLKRGEQVLHDIQSVLDAHRDYWEGICAHQSPDVEQEYLREFVNSQSGQGLEYFTGKEVHLVARTLRTKSAAGLDCWSNESIRRMDESCAASLASMFNRILHEGVWPIHLRSARVSLLPKPGAPSEQPSSWRPITITSSFYRMFARVCLWKCIQAVLPFLPSEILGGIPQRSAQRAVIKVYLWIERLICSGEGSLYGVSLDASKCFDRISLSDAIRAGTTCGVPMQVLAPVVAFYLGHQRHTSVRHFLDKKKWAISRGLIQGCSISVLLCCCVMRSWHEAVGPEICAYSFVDDRLLLTDNAEDLSASWRASEEWDHTHQWELNQKKSTHFVLGPSMDALTWMNEPLTEGNQFVWLGHEYFTKYNSARTIWPKRLSASQDSLRKLTYLHVSPITKQKVSERAVSPMFAYGVHSTLPPVSQMKGLSSSIKQALWGPNKKRFHCWPLACSILYRAHCVDVKSALIYNHITWMCEALNDVGIWDLYQDLIHGVRRLKPRGPAQLLDQLLTELGGAITPDKKLDLGRFGCAELGEKKSLTHNLRQCLRHRLLDLACTKRRHLDLGGNRVDIRRSTQLYRQQHVKHRSGLVTLLTDGAITQERLHHMGDGIDDQCSFCGRAKEGIRHVLWECERWEEYRVYRADDELLADLPPAALLCGLALDSFTCRQQKIWMRVQEQCSAILERHQLELCKPHTQSARVCPQTSQPLVNAPMRMPEPATHAQWSRGSFLAVAHNANVASSRVPWMFQ